MTTFLVVGESLVDVIVGPDGSQTEHPGGSPANVAYGLGRLDDDVTLLTQFGPDARGHSIAAQLATAGVAVLVSGAVTSTATAQLDAAGAATYSFDVRWDLSVLGAPTSQVLHIGSIGALLAPGADQVRALATSRRPSTLISLDPNIRPALLGPHPAVLARVEHLVVLADVVKVSDEDLSWLYPDVPALDVAARWHGSGTTLVVLTRGSAGAVAFFGGSSISVPSASVTVVDTVGAGDSFMAALLDALVRSMTAPRSLRAQLVGLPATAIADALSWAAAAAAVTVSRSGAALPSRAEVTGGL